MSESIESYQSMREYEVLALWRVRGVYASDNPENVTLKMSDMRRKGERGLRSLILMVFGKPTGRREVRTQLRNGAKECF